MLRLKKHGFHLFAIVAVAFIVFSGVEPAHAAQFTLFSTGVDASGNPLPGSTVDPHYTVNGGSAFVVDCPLCVGWIDNTTTSAWISADPGTAAGGGPFTYETTFDLTGFTPSTAMLAGFIAADDQASIFLNGVDVFDTVPTASEPWSFFGNFTISSGFVAGINTLDIVVPNNIETPDDGPTGLQLNISGTVPEPATLPMMGLGVVLLGFMRRKLAA